MGFRIAGTTRQRAVIAQSRNPLDLVVCRFQPLDADARDESSLDSAGTHASMLGVTEPGEVDDIGVRTATTHTCLVPGIPKTTESYCSAEQSGLCGSDCVRWIHCLANESFVYI